MYGSNEPNIKSWGLKRNLYFLLVNISGRCLEYEIERQRLRCILVKFHEVKKVYSRFHCEKKASVNHI